LDVEAHPRGNRPRCARHRDRSVLSFAGASMLGAATPFLISLGASISTYLVTATVEARPSLRIPLT
jgi:hypothetical protein